MGIRRRNFEAEEENHDRWLVSYADFITLLFAFFVVMYGLSSINQKKYQDLTSALGTAFGKSAASHNGHGRHPSQYKNNGINMPPLPLDHLKNHRQQYEREKMTAVASQLASELSGLIHLGKLHIMQNNQGIRIDISDNVLFSQGSAELSAESEALLQQIADVLRSNNYPLQVEGHTDNVPIHNAQFFSNWELSAVRASSMVRTLAKHGIAESRLSASGFGASRPLADNETEEGRARNRRVSMTLLQSQPADAEGTEVLPKLPKPATAQ